MALDNVEITEQLAQGRVSASCPTLQSLARQASQLSQIMEVTIGDIITEITNIVNTGGGVATPVYVIRALVNVVGGVTAATATFNFDGATDVFTHNGNPSGVTSGTAHNVQQRPFQDNEVVILTSFGNDIWLADKISESLIEAEVDATSGVTTGFPTFSFKNAVARIGIAPAGGTGTAVNIPATAYGHEEKVLLIQADDGTWRVLQDDDDLGGGGGGGGTIQVAYGTLAEDVSRSEITVTMNVVGYTGDNPGSTLNVTNPPDAILGTGNRIFLGNTGGFCIAINFSTGWQLVACQTPYRRPV